MTRQLLGFDPVAQFVGVYLGHPSNQQRVLGIRGGGPDGDLLENRLGFRRQRRRGLRRRIREPGHDLDVLRVAFHQRQVEFQRMIQILLPDVHIGLENPHFEIVRILLDQLIDELERFVVLAGPSGHLGDLAAGPALLFVACVGIVRRLGKFPIGRVPLAGAGIELGELEVVGRGLAERLQQLRRCFEVLGGGKNVRQLAAIHFLGRVRGGGSLEKSKRFLVRVRVLRLDEHPGQAGGARRGRGWEGRLPGREFAGDGRLLRNKRRGGTPPRR